MNRYKLHIPREDIALPGEIVFFDHGTQTLRGIVTQYSRPKGYTIAVGEPPAFHFNVRNIYRSNNE